jgi:putative membrane protein
MRKVVRALPINVARGFLMGTADIVPGVSGGTVALVLGIYRRLVTAIRNGSSALGRFLRVDVRGALRRLGDVEWPFLISLLVGIGLAIVALSHLVERLLENRPVEIAGLFLGLVLGSAVIAWQLLNRRDTRRLVVLASTTVMVFLALGVREGTTEETVTQAADPALWAFLGAGAIAICAMILPGISGSFFLVMLGMYSAVLGAVNDRDLVSLGVFIVGCVVGLALFSQVLHWALGVHYDTVMAVLIGLMLGSLRVLWPWPAGVESTTLSAPAAPVVAPMLLALGGFVIVVGFDRLARRLERRDAADEAEELHQV